jgi:hypothetical protein
MGTVDEKYRALDAIGSFGKAMNSLEGVEVVSGRVEMASRKNVRVGGGTKARRLVDALLCW